MLTSRACSVIVLLLALGAAGCGEDEVDVEALADGAIEAAQQVQDALGNTCDCSAEFGFPSEEACMEAIGTVAINIDRQCTIDALKMDPDAAKANFDCERENLAELSNCFEAAIDACNQDDFVACDDAEETTCPEVPKEMDEALDACIE